MSSCDLCKPQTLTVSICVYKLVSIFFLKHLVIISLILLTPRLKSHGVGSEQQRASRQRTCSKCPAQIMVLSSQKATARSYPHRMIFPPYDMVQVTGTFGFHTYVLLLTLFRERNPSPCCTSSNRIAIELSYVGN